MKSNLIYIYNKVYRVVLMVLCVVSFFSCVKVELCRESNHTHMGDVKIIYHWPENISEEQRPDSMLALVNRIINTRRVGYVTGPETSVGGRYRFGQVYNDAMVGGTEADEHPLMVGAGEYQIFAFNNDVADVNKGGTGMNDVPDYRIDNLEEFGDGAHIATVSIRDLGISYVSRDRTDPRLYLYGKDWVDFNPYTKYIATDITPIYRAFNEHDEATQDYTFTVEINGRSEVHLYPEKMTQDITIAFPIYTDEGVKVDSIIAEISGIPRKMMIYTGTLVVDTTYKMLFKMDIDENSAEEVTLKIKEGEGDAALEVDKPFTRWQCMSSFSVIGLVANSDPKNYTGAGILQLCIYSHATDDNGVVKTKTQYAKINMYNTINNANLVITDDYGNAIQNPGTYSQLPRTDTLRIDDSFLMVMRDLVLKTSDDDNSVDSWWGDSDGDGEIDDDHKFDVEI